MEKKEKLNIAVRLLKERIHYYKNGVDSVKFDVKKLEDSVYVFPRDKEEDAFFWLEEVYEVAAALGLSYYIHTNGRYHKIEARIYC